MTSALLTAALTSAIDPLDRDAELVAFRAGELNLLARTQIRYVASRAIHYARTGRCDLDEVFLCGMEGLARGLTIYDPAIGTRVNTYVAIWINRYMLNLIEVSGTPLAGTRTSRTSMFFTLKKLQAALEGVPHNERDAVIARFANTNSRCRKRVVSPARLKLLLSFHERGMPVSLDAPVGRDPEAGDWHEFLADSTALDPESAAAVSDEQHRAREAIDAAMKCLPERERVIIRLTLLCHEGEKVTLESLGQMFGVSRERIRQLQEMALARLRRAMKAPPIVKERRLCKPRRPRTGGIQGARLTHDGLSLTAPEWAKRLGLCVSTIYQRRADGLPMERVLCSDDRRASGG